MILPLLIILLAFFFLEKYDKRVDILSSLKKMFNLSPSGSSETPSPTVLAKLKPYPTELSNYSYQLDDTTSDELIVNEEHDNLETQDINNMVNTVNDEYQERVPRENETDTKMFQTVNQFDYPLHKSSSRDTKHYIPETKHDSIEIGLNNEFVFTEQEEDPVGYETKEHFTYFVGEKFDKLYQ